MHICVSDTCNHGNWSIVAEEERRLVTLDHIGAGAVKITGDVQHDDDESLLIINY